MLAGVLMGHEVGLDEIVTLFSARGPEVAAVADVADELRQRAVGDVVTWVANRNINYTNVCTFKCRFCAFSKGPLSLNLRGAPYLLELDEITSRVAEADALGATEVCLQGGIHPSFDGDYYLEVIKAVRAASETIHIHGFTALEVTEGAKRLGEPLGRLPAAPDGGGPQDTAGYRGRDPRRRGPGGAVPRQGQHRGMARRASHRALGRAAVERHDHVRIDRATRAAGPATWCAPAQLQKETGGFTEFVPLPFVHMAAPIYLQRKSRRGPTFREALLMHAVGRIAYHGCIPNIQVSLGEDGSRGRDPDACDPASTTWAAR